MNARLILVVVAFLILGTGAFNLTASQIVLPPNLSKMSYDKADEIINSEAHLIVGTKAKQIGSEYLTNLVYQLQNEDLSNEKKVLIVYLMGTLRPTDVNSIGALIQYIDLKATILDPKTDIRRWGEYPAQEALIKIGESSVAPILAYLPHEAKQMRRHLMNEVLIKVEGKEVAKKEIQNKLLQETNLQRKTNLEAALKELSQ